MSPSALPLYPDYLPVRPEGPSKPIDVPPFDIEELGSRANREKPDIFTPSAQIKNITPRIGAEIRGVQISHLTADGLDQLALLAVERGVLVFVRLHQALCQPTQYVLIFFWRDREIKTSRI